MRTPSLRFTAKRPSDDWLPRAIRERLQLNSGHPLVPSGGDLYTPSKKGYEQEITLTTDMPQRDLSQWELQELDKEIGETLGRLFDMLFQTLNHVIYYAEETYEKRVGKTWAVPYVLLMTAVDLYKEQSGRSDPDLSNYDEFSALLEQSEATGIPMDPDLALEHYQAFRQQIERWMGGPEKLTHWLVAAKKFRKHLREQPPPPTPGSDSF